MPRLTNRPPKYRKHASGQAVVKLDGASHYLGAYGTPESHEAYNRFCAQWSATGHATGDGITVTELLARYVKWAATYYVKEGKRTTEYDCVLSAIRPLKELYGRTPAGELGPAKVKRVREAMIADGWSRGFINKSVARLKRMLRWAVEEELVPPAVHQAVAAVSALQAGRSEAKESPGRFPVPEADLEAVRKVVKQKTRDLIDLQLLTAARPGELLGLTWGQIDQSGEVWIARLKRHKNQHHGKDRVLYFGPKAQLILTKYWKVSPELLVFGKVSYRDRIAKGCERAKVKRWSPHCLRHNAATRLRDELGIEAAQVLCGHSKADMTLHYAKQADKTGRAVALKVG